MDDPTDTPTRTAFSPPRTGFATVCLGKSARRREMTYFWVGSWNSAFRLSYAGSATPRWHLARLGRSNSSPSDGRQDRCPCFFLRETSGSIPLHTLLLN